MDINLEINLLGTYGAEMGCKNLKVSLIVEEGLGLLFNGQRQQKPYFLMFAMKESMLLCQECIEY